MIIKPNSNEQELFTILKLVADKHGTTLRAVGGFCRDKVMGLDSHDIDIMVSGMSGKDFAECVAKYLHEVKGEDLKNVGVVSARPDQSKHLETAILNINGFSVDFVAPRNEVYLDNSRIPTIKPATEKEDAYRRDLTINSLFLNLQTNEIEDFTGQGIQDIHDRLIRTPLPPKQTLLDDPLRLLRIIRFAARLDFDVAPDLLEAGKDSEVLEAFRSKVSRERIEIELRKILTEDDPARGLRLIDFFGLTYDIFKIPKGFLHWKMYQNTPYHKLNVYDHSLTALDNLHKLLRMYMPEYKTEDILVCSYAILLHDLGKLNPKIHGTKNKNGEIRTTYYGHEEHSIAATEEVLRNLPGVSVKEIERVKLLIDGARRVNSNYTPTNEKCGMGRKAIGKFIRHMRSDWRNAILVSMADASGKDIGLFDKFNFTYYITMIEAILNLGPDKIQKMKPLLNGNEIIEILGKSGPIVGKVVDKMIDWQLANPDVSKKDAIGFAKSFKNQV